MRCALLRVRPNSEAALIALMVSPPALASPTTCALLACACSRYEAKSLAPIGWRAAPSTLPPVSLITAVAESCSVCPKA
ncbi:hypothetical protein D9M72_558750 [compost metagenome]